MKNKTTNKLIRLVLILTLTGLFFSCNQQEKHTIRIAFVVPTLQNPYFVDMTNSAKDEAKTLKNVEVIVQAPEKVEDAIGQNQMVENLITQKVDAICVV